MSAFFERLRAALAPDYELLRELARGGMGSVCLVRDVARHPNIVAIHGVYPKAGLHYYAMDYLALGCQEAP